MTVRRAGQVPAVGPPSETGRPGTRYITVNKYVIRLPVGEYGCVRVVCRWVIVYVCVDCVRAIVYTHKQEGPHLHAHTNVPPDSPVVNIGPGTSGHGFHLAAWRDLGSGER